ncbi:MAG: GatB/YqeY domain-containing protein [Actinobacteria bacterium]|nr:GatB/YqeY domain-containing protein [Actinomycetota bacterium]
MSLKEKLQNDLTDAMRSRDELRSSTIRMVLTAIKNEEVSGKKARELSDAEIITVLSREGKKRREAAEAFEQAGANNRAATEKAEGGVIAEYLPKQLSESEIKDLIAAAIKESGAATPAQMGLVMRVLQPKIAGKADGGTVSALVKAALTGGAQ